MSKNSSFLMKTSFLILVYLVLALLHGVANPIFESSDEMWHIGMAVRLSRGEGLPIQRPGEETLWRQEGSQPPLYYALLAGLTWGLGLPLDDFLVSLDHCLNWPYNCGRI
jgi:hypothetical protein